MFVGLRDLSFGRAFLVGWAFGLGQFGFGISWIAESFYVEGERFGAMRFLDEIKGEQAADPDPLGDVILARKDVGTSYHIAVVHDDALQGMTHIIRGEDLFELTPLHVLLQTLLDLPTPVYRHHRLLTDAKGQRFAKRNLAATLKSMREAGMSAEEVRAKWGV